MFGIGQWFKANTYLFKQLCRIKSNPVDFCLIQIQPVEIEQVTYQFKQMLRGTFHIVQIETLSFIRSQPGQ